MTRLRFSTLAAVALVMVAILLAAAAVLLNYSGDPHGNKIVVKVRLWAAPIAAAYRESFKAFNRTHPDIEVHTNMVAYSNYFQTLRTDVAGGSADDIFWLSNAYLAAYADNGRLLNISKAVDQHKIADWEPAVVDQFSRGGVLWGVPQLTDGGIAVYYNADLLAAAGIDPSRLNSLRWSPGDDDTLRPLRHSSPSMRMERQRAHRVSTRCGYANMRTTRPTTRRASTSTTSARPAECSSAATASPSTIPGPSRLFATWSG